jgi:tetratricopeptide (TPR) repeat protein
MKTQKSIAWLLLMILPMGFLVLWQLQQRIDVRHAELHQEQDELALSSGKLVKAMSLEYAPLMADIYWTRAVQYYGDKKAHADSNFELLWPLLDITTTLDPQLLVAYRFGSTFLSEPAGHGAGRPDLGVELVKRGIQANPDSWRLYYDLGFIYYFNLKDYPKASAAFLEGSKNPHALVWMKVLAAKVAEQGESRETSAFLWNDLYNSATDPQVKKNALTHLQLLRAQTDCEHIDAIADEYEKRMGRPPATLRDLIRAGLLGGTPVDPLGYVYVIGADGKAQLNPASPLFKEKRIYTKPL